MNPLDQNPTIASLVKQWDDFIADVTQRFQALLEEAKAGSQPLVDAIESDLGTLTAPWTAVKHQMHKFTSEISDQWDSISDGFSEALEGRPDELEEAADEIMDREGDKRDLANTEIEIRYETAYREVMARASDRMRQTALKKDAAERACTHCGAALDKVNMVEQALNVECAYCEAMNTIEPSTALRMFAAAGGMYLAEKAALEHWQAMMRSEARMKAYRRNKDVPMDLLKAYEHAARNYWTIRLNTEADFVPEQKKYVDAKLDSYMKGPIKTLRQYPQWKAAQAAQQA